MSKPGTPMRPKLMASAFVAPVVGGVLVRNWAGEAMIHGSDLQPLAEDLLHLLDGTREMSQLLAGIDSERRDRAMFLVGALAELRAVRDAARDMEVGSDLRRLYASSLGQLEQFCPAPGRAFLAFRQTPILVAGGGGSHLALLEALTSVGAATIYTWTADRETRLRVRALVDGRRDLDPDLRWADVSDHHLATITVDWSAAIHAGREYADAIALELTAIARRRGVVVLHGGAASNHLFLGPLVRPNSMGCPGCLSMRIGERNEVRLSALHRFVLADMLATWLFRYLTGSPTPDRSRGVVSVDLSTWRTTAHYALPHDGCITCDPQGMRTSITVEACLSRAAVGASEFVERTGKLVDELIGPLASVDGSEYPQSPVRQLRVSFRRNSSRTCWPVDVVVPGRSEPEVRYRAVRLALAAYAQRVSGEPDERGWSWLDGTRVQCAAKVQWVFVTGLSYWEWAAAGLLNLMGVRLRGGGEQRGREIRLDGVLSRETMNVVRALRHIADIEITAHELQGHSCAAAAAVILSGSDGQVGTWVDIDQDSALTRGVLSMAQRVSNRTSMLAGSTAWEVARAVGVGLLHDLPGDREGWRAWVRGTEAAYRDQGLAVAVQPSVPERALADCGLLTGFVGTTSSPLGR